MDDATMVSRKELIQARFEAWVNAKSVIYARRVRDKGLVVLLSLMTGAFIAALYVIMNLTIVHSGVSSIILYSVIIFFGDIRGFVVCHHEDGFCRRQI